MPGRFGISSGVGRSSASRRNCYANSGRCNCDARSPECSWTQQEYISKEKHPLFINLYLKIGQDFTPRLLRWPINAFLKISNLYSNAVETIRRKLRGHYYEWK